MMDSSSSPNRPFSPEWGFNAQTPRCGLRDSKCPRKSEVSLPTLIILADDSALDFENTLSYVLTVAASDLGGLSADAVITVNVSNINEPPLITGQTAISTT